MNFIADGIIISLIWFLSIYTVKKENIDKLLDVHLSRNFKTKFMIVVKMVILTTLVINIFKAFGIGGERISSLISFLRSPGIGQLIFVLELILLVEYSFHGLINFVGPGYSNSEKNKIVFGNVLVILGVSLLMFYIKGVIWGNYKYLYSSIGAKKLYLDLLLGGVFVLIPAINMIYFGYHYIDKKVSVYNTLPLVLLLGLTNTLIVNALLLVDIVWKSYVFIKEGFVKKIINEENKLLLLYSSCENGRSISRINAYFLYGSVVTTVFLWSLAGGAYTNTTSFYGNSSFVGLFFVAIYGLFWVIERISRLFGKFGDIIRMVYIPGSVWLAIYPFYTKHVMYSDEISDVSIQSVYHLMDGILGEDIYLFFISLILGQASVGYVLYILTGTAKRKKNFFAILPMIGILQLVILSLVFPVLMVMPPYFVNSKKYVILWITIAVSVLVILLVSMVGYKLFTYKHIHWKVGVRPFWKKKMNVYIGVTFITAIIFTPLIFRSFTAIKNENVRLEWTKEIGVKDGYEVKEYFYHEYNDSITFVSTNGSSFSLQNQVLDGMEIKWQLANLGQFENFLEMNNQYILGLKIDQGGFAIIDSLNGEVMYDYTTELEGEAEFYQIDFNEQAVLMTENTKQFVFDLDVGMIELETIGNNFFKLINGNQLALLKNSLIYTYGNEEWLTQETVSGLSSASFVYNYQKGMLMVNQNVLMQYNETLTERLLLNYDFSPMEIKEVGEKNYAIDKNHIYFLLEKGDHVFGFSYGINTDEINVVNLEQKIVRSSDKQEIAYDKKGNGYVLYDGYQFTYFENGQLLGRYWLEEGMTERKIEIGLPPLVIGEKVLLFNNNDEVQCIKMIK